MTFPQPDPTSGPPYQQPIVSDQYPTMADPTYQQPPYAQPTPEPQPYPQGQPQSYPQGQSQPYPPEQPYPPGYPGQPVQGYPQSGPGYPAYGHPYATYGPAAQTNTMAILALIFAFVFSPLGIVFGHIARKQIRERGEGGQGLATAGMIVGYVFTGLMVLYCGATIIFVMLAANANST